MTEPTLPVSQPSKLSREEPVTFAYISAKLRELSNDAPEDAAMDLAFMAESLKVLVAERDRELQQAREELDRETSAHLVTIDDRDTAQDALAEAHRALGGDGEWVAKLYACDPGETGDLRIDVPVIAAQIFKETTEAQEHMDEISALGRELQQAVAAYHARSKVVLRSGWLNRQFDHVSKNVNEWPDWMKRAAYDGHASRLKSQLKHGKDANGVAHLAIRKLVSELSEAREELARLRELLAEAPHEPGISWNIELQKHECDDGCFGCKADKLLAVPEKPDTK